MADQYEFRFIRSLFDHIKLFHNNQLKSILDKDLAQRFDGFGTLLNHAAYWGNVEIVERLIELGSDIDFRGDGGRTPLMMAVQNEHLATVKVLLQAGANVDIVDDNGLSVLKMVFHEDYFDASIVEMFLYQLKSKHTDNTSLTFKLAKYNCAPHHAIILGNILILKGLLVWTKHEHSLLDKELHVAFRRDITTMYVCLELDNELNEPNSENILYLSSVSGTVLLHTKETNGIPFSYNNNLKENDCLPKKFKVCSWTYYRCWDDSEKHFWHQSNNAKMLIAYLVLLEKLGKPVFQTAKCLKTGWYDGKPVFTEKYHELCQEILNKRVFGNSRLIDLLTDPYEQMRTFLRNESFATTIEEACSDLQLSKLFPYYYKPLMIRIERAKEIVKMEDEAIVVISKIFSSSYNKSYLFARKVVSYLNKQELRLLCLVDDETKLY